MADQESFIQSQIMLFKAAKLDIKARIKMLIESLKMCRWNLRSWSDLLDCIANIDEMQKKEILKDLESANSAQNPEVLLSILGIECEIKCGNKCSEDPESDCQKRIKNLFDCTGSEWWCPSDNATIEISESQILSN